MYIACYLHVLAGFWLPVDTLSVLFLVTANFILELKIRVLHKLGH